MMNRDIIDNVEYGNHSFEKQNTDGQNILADKAQSMSVLDKNIRILITDDPIVSAGFKQVLSETPDMVIADEAGNGQEVPAYLKKNMMKTTQK